MTQTQINGSEQIKSGSVTHTQVDSSIIVAAGSNAFSGNQDMGGHKITGGANGTSANDYITLSQAQNLLQGLSPLISVQAMTTGSETFTIASGSVTQIAGTNIDGVTTWTIGDRILIKNAPSATGVGSADSGGAGTDQPANGVYSIIGTTTNLTVTRDSTSNTPLSTGVQPSGKFVFCDEGTANKGAGYIVLDPASPDTAFTYGTTNMQWGKFNSSSSGTVTTASVVSANGFAGTVANASTTPSITLTTTITGVLKGNGTVISAATAGTDYMAPSNWVSTETPSGTVNGSNTAFTLANTPNSNVTNPVMLYLNGTLLEPGSGNDYTISGSSITMLFAPATGDKLRAYYWK
jgi:hypothetical protein